MGRLEKRVRGVDADERIIRGNGKAEGAKCWRSLEGNGERGDIDYVYGDNAIEEFRLYRPCVDSVLLIAQEGECKGKWTVVNAWSTSMLALENILYHPSH